MEKTLFEETVERILEKDSRYHSLAYVFVVQALHRARSNKPAKPEEEIIHVTGQELLEGFRQHALETFGSAAVNTLNEWGIHSCRDVGEIVFNMVEHGLVAKTEQDSRADFENGYDFVEVFPKPFYKNPTFIVVCISLFLLLIALLAFGNH